MDKDKLIIFHVDSLYQYCLGEIDRAELAKRYGLFLKEDIDKIKGANDGTTNNVTKV